MHLIDNRISLLVDAFTRMSEEDFTTTVLMPLFEHTGYVRVDYHGGPHEYGKDLICWKTNELDEQYLMVAQVKKYKFTAKAADSQSFLEIVRQLTQAVDKKVPHIDGTEHLPSIVYFITPFPLSTRVLDSAFESYRALRLVRVLDGAKIADLICTKVPRLASSVLGVNRDIHSVSRSHLSNDTLLSALGYSQRKDLKKIYTDIGLTLGRVTSRLFFGTTLAGSRQTQTVLVSEWSNLKSAANAAKKHFGVTIFPWGTFDRYDRKFKAAQVEYDTLKTAADNVRKAREASVKATRELVPVLNTLVATKADEVELRTDILQFKACVKSLGLSIEQAHVMIDQETFGATDYESIERDFESCRKLLDNLVQGMRGAVDDQLAGQLENTKTTALETIALGVLPQVPREPDVSICIDGTALAQQLLAVRLDVKSHLSAFKSESPSSKQLRAFFDNVETILRSTEPVLCNTHVCRAVGIPEHQRYELDRDDLRISSPMNRIFASGAHLSVFGEAGAGKSTALQMYAAELLQDSPETIALYIPLATMMRTWSARLNLVDSQRAPDLAEGISQFLSAVGANISAEEFRQVLTKERSVVLFDGIDEVIGAHGWISNAITQFSKLFPRAQIVTSSRMSGEYINEIPFVPVTLLPFTSDQRTQFVNAWFQEGDVSNTTAIQAHLDSNVGISDVTRTPLLATVLCTLQDRGVPLPESEVMLYEERMRLLLGDYDLKKEVKRTRTDRRMLELLTRKLAFELHVAETREESREWFYARAEHYGRRGQSLDARRAIDELIDPCNVIVPMTSIGEYGFGHFRYQEYLVAKEANINRFVDLRRYLGNRWWTGVLQLIGQLSEDIAETLLFLVGNQFGDKARRESIDAIIASRPRDEWDGLRARLADRCVENGVISWDRE